MRVFVFLLIAIPMTLSICHDYSTLCFHVYTSYFALLWSHRDISGFCVGTLVLCLSLLWPVLVGHVFETERKDLEIGFALLSTVRLGPCTSWGYISGRASYLQIEQSVLQIYHSSAQLLLAEPLQKMILKSTFGSRLRLKIGSRLVVY